MAQGNREWGLWPLGPQKYKTMLVYFCKHHRETNHVLSTYCKDRLPGCILELHYKFEDIWLEKKTNLAGFPMMKGTECCPSWQGGFYAVPALGHRGRFSLLASAQAFPEDMTWRGRFMMAWIIHAAGGVKSGGLTLVKWLTIFFRQPCWTKPVRPAVRRAGRGLCLGKTAKTPLLFGQEELVLHQYSWRHFWQELW